MKTTCEFVKEPRLVISERRAIDQHDILGRLARRLFSQREEAKGFHSRSDTRADVQLKRARALSRPQQTRETRDGVGVVNVRQRGLESDRNPGLLALVPLFPAPALAQAAVEFVEG